MLTARKPKSRAITGAVRHNDRLYLSSEAGTHRLEPKNDRIIRITYTEKETFSEAEKPGVTERGVYGNWTFEETPEEVILRLAHVELVVCKETASYRYYDQNGTLLLREREKDSKELEEFPVSRISDGVRYHTRLHLVWGDEALYGLGQQEEGLGSLRRQTVYVHQANRKIAVPMLVSTKGYGILTDTYSPLIFSDTVYGSYLYTEADREMDFYFINGGSMDGVIAGYRKLTGKAALLPRWAYGYWQSQERYETQEEILETALAYRKRGIGLDCIVLDWCSWEDGKWGQKNFDPTRFPDPAAMIASLHENHVHFMLSIWPNMEESTENYREFREKGLLLPGQTVYDPFREEARALYWKQTERGLARYGVDAWWCDNSEPFTPEWNHRTRPEASRMYEEYCQTAGQAMPAEQMDAFGLYHARTLYEGQRACYGRRVCILTRSGTTGQQRYGVVLWSGDVEASWETLRRQIAAGLHFCASGLPYWTVDIGGFFVKNGDYWYWKGEYPDTAADLGYRELFVRWYQWAAFLPVFRGHGTDCQRELWQFANKEQPFYDALLAANALRYRLLPYLYSLAGLCYLQDRSLIRFLAFAFPEDREVWEIRDQYLFGPGLMVCPVTEPFWYGANSVRLDKGPAHRRVYLPAGCKWYDFWTDACYEGGQWIDADAPLTRIPLFVKAGTILLLAQPALSAEEQKPGLQARVFSGADAELLFYEDAGDGYGYEAGEYRLTALRWKEAEQAFQTGEIRPMEKGNKDYEIEEWVVVRP